VPGARKARVVEVKHLGRVGAIAVVTVRDDAGNTGDDTVKLHAHPVASARPARHGRVEP
jgi:hypothetical protein